MFLVIEQFSLLKGAETTSGSEGTGNSDKIGIELSEFREMTVVEANPLHAMYMTLECKEENSKADARQLRSEEIATS